MIKAQCTECQHDVELTDEQMKWSNMWKCPKCNASNFISSPTGQIITGGLSQFERKNRNPEFSGMIDRIMSQPNAVNNNRKW